MKHPCQAEPAQIPDDTLGGTRRYSRERCVPRSPGGELSPVRAAQIVRMGHRRVFSDSRSRACRRATPEPGAFVLISGRRIASCAAYDLADGTNLPLAGCRVIGASTHVSGV